MAAFYSEQQFWMSQVYVSSGGASSSIFGQVRIYLKYEYASVTLSRKVSCFIILNLSQSWKLS